MSAPSVSSAYAPRTSVSADIVRLAVPLLVIAASIVATLWIEGGGFGS
jgi:hypothetical protein